MDSDDIAKFEIALSEFESSQKTLDRKLGPALTQLEANFKALDQVAGEHRKQARSSTNDGHSGR